MVAHKDLISKEYLHQNAILHRGKEGFGGSGWKHTDAILAYAEELQAKTLLDYGAGECTLYREIKKRDGVKLKMAMYDPAVFKLSRLPKPAHLVVCTDVLEHVEPEKLDAVLNHLATLTERGCYLSIATRPANKILPNGKNAHAIIEDTPWWMQRLQVMVVCGLQVHKFTDVRKGGVPTGAPHEVRVWFKR